MTPYLGQGANSALVDALIFSRLLAQELHGRGDLAALAGRYEGFDVPIGTLGPPNHIGFCVQAQRRRHRRRTGQPEQGSGPTGDRGRCSPSWLLS